MRTIIAVALLIAAAAAAVGLWLGFGHGAFAPWRSPPAPRPIVVQTSPVALAKLPQSFSAAAELEVEKPVPVHAETRGRVKSIASKEGDTVSKGQPILRLDDSASKAELANAREKLAQSQASFDRAMELYNKGFFARESLDAAARELKAAETQVNLVETRLGSTTVHAPAFGTISRLEVDIGDRVSEGQEVATLEPFERLVAAFRVPQLASPVVRKGQRLRVTTEALPKQRYEGRVLSAEPSGDESNAQLAIRVQVRNRDGHLRPGMQAQAFIPTAGAEEALTVPREALFEVGADEYVYKVVAGKAVQQKVDVGRQAEGRVEVLSGLSKEDLVVTTASAPLTNGAAVSESGTAPTRKIESCAQCTVPGAA